MRYGMLGLILVSWVLVGLWPRPIQAQTPPPIVVDAQAATAQFPTQIVFSLDAHHAGGGQVAQAALLYRVAGDPYTREARAVFTPSAQVALTATVDTGALYIPPGVDIRYYWTLEDASGARLDTAAAVVRYTDRRATWQTRQVGMVQLAWQRGDAAFGDVLEAAVRGGLARLAAQTGLTATLPIQVWVYGDEESLRSALPPGGPEWIGGQAFPDQNVIVCFLADDAHAEVEARRVLPHELTHLITNAATRNPYNKLPTWLDEGLAVRMQADEDPALAQALAQARAARALLPLRTLEAGFPAESDAALLAYAEGAGAVQFLLDQGGAPRMGALLAQFPAGVTYDEALAAVYGIPTDTVDTLWQITMDGGATITLGGDTRTPGATVPPPQITPRPTRTVVLSVPVPATQQPGGGVVPTPLPAAIPPASDGGLLGSRGLRLFGAMLAIGVFLGVFGGRWWLGRKRTR